MGERLTRRAQQNNCLHEIFFDQAIELAESLDTHLVDNKTVVGPLHGLPVSLKDQFHVKGVDTTMGYVGWIGGNLGVKHGQTHKVESQITRELLALGAVLYCKTSLPQTLLFGETKNNVIGQTLNPRNQNLSCGGSSGGEGALQALRGSTLGVGTDSMYRARLPNPYPYPLPLIPSAPGVGLWLMLPVSWWLCPDPRRLQWHLLPQADARAFIIS